MPSHLANDLLTTVVFSLSSKGTFKMGTDLRLELGSDSVWQSLGEMRKKFNRNLITKPWPQRLRGLPLNFISQLFQFIKMGFVRTSLKLELRLSASSLCRFWREFGD
jgi:hypothetical protein